MNTKVSIIVGCFMQEQYVDKAYWSAMNQDYKGEIEVIVNHDGCMTNKPGTSASKARNYAIEHLATGDYIICLDADDLLPTNYVRALMETEHKKDNWIAGCPVQFISGRTLERFGVVDAGEYLIDDFKYHVPPIPSAALFSREGWKKVGGYNETLKSMEDFDFWYMQLAQQYAYYHTLDTCLLKNNDGLGKVHRTSEAVRQTTMDYMNHRYSLELILPKLVK